MSKKRGSVSVETTVAIVLAVVLLVTLSGLIIRAFVTDNFVYSVEESVCHNTLIFSKSADFPALGRIFSPICKPIIFLLNKETLDDVRAVGESDTQATMHFLAEKMTRCQHVYYVENNEELSSHNYCYVCYGLQSDVNDPLKVNFTTEAFSSYIVSAKSPRDKTYLRELQEGYHSFTLQLEDGSFHPDTTDYGIFYIDNVESNDWSLISGIGGGTLCAIGAISGLFSFGITTGIACGASVLMTAHGVVQQFDTTNYDSVVLTELKYARDICSEVVTS